MTIKYRSKTQRQAIKDEILSNVNEDLLEDAGIREFIVVLDKFVNSKSGETYEGRIALDLGKTLEYFLPGRRIFKQYVRIRSS